MYIPIIRKVMKTNDVFVERTLPRKGELVAKEKEVVEPFTKLGMTKVSYGNLPLPARLRVTKGRAVGSYFYTGDTLGKIGSKKVIAPFDGTLIEQSGGGFLFNQEDRDFWLLSGVWGEVVSVVEKSSALIRTQMLDVKLAIATDHSYSGELIVFPNPSELLEMQYLQKFSKDSFGKIIYVGHHINEALVKKAHELGVAGLIAGSVDRDALVAAKKTDLFVGAFSGFGVIPTPDYIFDILKGVTNRYIFLQGNKNLLRIPAEKPYPTKDIRPNSYTGQLRSVKKGLLVQVFEEPFFGWTGKVHSMQGSSVQVIIDEGRDPVKIKIPSIISLE
ncbi:hypothetical protein HN803_08140 [candidate division WWE3 bacterium]|jgi:hypothetical protein|nr:hypothetical protein [candidate division WWE3 bacterium]